jgi:hypothetical protein
MFNNPHLITFRAGSLIFKYKKNDLMLDNKDIKEYQQLYKENFDIVFKNGNREESIKKIDKIFFKYSKKDQETLEYLSIKEVGWPLYLDKIK